VTKQDSKHWSLLLAVVFFGSLAFIEAKSAETHTSSEFHEVRDVAGRLQGARHSTREACIVAAEALGVAEGAKRTGGEAFYNCYSVKSFKFTFKPGTVSPPPSSTFETPKNFTALPISTTSVNLNWQAVEGAKRYLIHRCNGATCTNFSQLSCYPNGTTRVHGSLTPGATYRYRIAASKNDYCNSGTNLSGWTSIISATTPMTVPNPPDPDPDPEPQPGTGTAVLSWTPPTQNTDNSTLTNLAGYRISYGKSATALTSTVQVANVRTHTIGGLPAGTYFFAVRAFTTNGSESANSNVVTKIVR
jgi:hypothetical protein